MNYCLLLMYPSYFRQSHKFHHIFQNPMSTIHIANGNDGLGEIGVGFKISVLGEEPPWNKRIFSD